MDALGRRAVPGHLLRVKKQTTRRSAATRVMMLGDEKKDLAVTASMERCRRKPASRFPLVRSRAPAASLTDASRLNQFASRSAEAQDSQAIINGANSMYGSTQWSNSDQHSLRIIANVQDPSDFRGRDVNTINTVYDWKARNYPSEATVVAIISVALRSGNQGVGCTNCMCTTTGSNLNNVPDYC